MVATRSTVATDWGRVTDLVHERYIGFQRHPVAPLTIYNYTQKAQFARMWTPETIACRGLIVADNNTIVARPFPKFFNLEEHGPDWVPPAGDFTVSAKLDGSLGILYPAGDGLAIATRGSFTSEQARHATKVFRSRYAHLPWDCPRHTYLFEIIYPGNRIVVDYGDLDDVMLLAVLDTDTGADLPLPAWFPNHVTTYDGIADLAALKGLEEANAEGFVVRFTDGQRIKVKFAEYVRLHRLVTGVTARAIWDLLRNGGTIDELLERVPEEFAAWVRQTAREIEARGLALHDRARQVEERIRLLPTRKEQATHPDMLADRALAAIVFAMLDGKSAWPIVWKMLRPEHERPFRLDEA
jgi:RNA ligase